MHGCGWGDWLQRYACVNLGKAQRDPKAGEGEFILQPVGLLQKPLACIGSSIASVCQGGNCLKIPVFFPTHSDRIMPDSWNPVFDTLHPCFQQLQPVRCWDGWDNWPACDHLSRILPQGLQAESGQPVCFLPQDETLPFQDLYYEERIFQHGIVSTRPNWHDFFNALMWGLYPHTKVMINARHAADLVHYGKPRTPQRDALTVLDESGVIIAASRRDLLEAVRAFAWEALFWQQRGAWWQEIGCFMIGHATLEKMLTPYMGVTAHALLVEVEPAFFSQSLLQQQAWLDGILAVNLQQGGLVSPASLNPFPLLGVPGWWAGNEEAGFYQHTDYFRPKTRERGVQIIAPA